MVQNLKQSILNFKNIKNCLDGEEYQRNGDIYTLRSNNHEKYLQKVNKSFLCTFDDKSCYINETDSKPWD